MNTTDSLLSQAGEAMRRALSLELQAGIDHSNGLLFEAGRKLCQANALRCEHRRLHDQIETHQRTLTPCQARHATFEKFAQAANALVRK